MNFIQKEIVKVEVKKLLFKAGKVMRHRKSKGVSNVFIGIALACVLALTVEWPLVKAIVSTVWTPIETWFTTKIASIFV